MQLVTLMKLFLSRYSLPLLYFLSAFVFLLLATSFLLYHQKNQFANHNRLLIVQNDSIMAENIKLKNIVLEQQGRFQMYNGRLSSLK